MTDYAKVRKMKDELNALSKAEECIRILSEKCSFNFRQKVIDVSPKNEESRETFSFDGKWTYWKRSAVGGRPLEFEVECTEEGLYELFTECKESYKRDDFVAFIERIKQS